MKHKLLCTVYIIIENPKIKVNSSMSCMFSRVDIALTRTEQAISPL